MITESHARQKPAEKKRYSWIDLRRQIQDAGCEKRDTPRIEFHCPVKIQGVNREKRVTNLSVGGLFIECENILIHKLRIGKKLDLLIKLPTYDELLTVKVRIASVGNRGIGCNFVNLNQKSKKAIRDCFNVFKHTLPIA
jgi:hypothetical protein